MDTRLAWTGLLLTILVGCTELPRNHAFYPDGVTSPIVFRGYVNAPSQPVTVMAHNFTTAHWDSVATTTCGGQPSITDPQGQPWYQYTTSRILGSAYWLNAGGIMRVAEIQTYSGNTRLGVFEDNTQAETCVQSNWSSGGYAIRTNCQTADAIASIFSCSAPPCTKWF